MSESEVYKALVFVVCYLIGSFPTAYILVKLKSGKDITKEGSGNVGTLNALTVTKSKASGIIVLLTDLLKGAVPIYLMLFVLKLDYAVVSGGALCLIIGHNYPLWLKFKGGRGLAPAAGIFLVLNYFILIGWCVVWALMFAVKRKVLIANTSATLLIPFYVYLVNRFEWMQKNITSEEELKYFTIFSILICLVILLRHSEVFKNFIPTKKEN